MSIFKPASKAQSYLRLAIFGPSGSGKTMTSLRVATGIGGRIAVIDTEHGSASKYADRWGFDTAPPEDASPEAMIRMADAAAGTYNVLIIDSLSHVWQYLTAENDKLAHRKYRGNTWSAWSESKPRLHALRDRLLAFPGHVIVTMRSRTEWVTEGSKPVKVGLAPEYEKGGEYDYDMLMEMSLDNAGIITKDRSGKFHNKTVERPGEAFGAELRDWLREGEPLPPPPPPPAPVVPMSTQRQWTALGIAMRALQFGDDDAGKQRARGFFSWLAGLEAPVNSVKDFTEAQASQAMQRIGGTGSDGRYATDETLLQEALAAWHEHLDYESSVAAHGAPPPAEPTAAEPAAEAPAPEAVDTDPTPEPAEAASTEQASLLPELDPNARPSRTRKAAMQPIGEDETTDEVPA